MLGTSSDCLLCSRHIPTHCYLLQMISTPGGFVFEKKCTSNAPKGDTFFTLVQITGQPVGNVATKIRVSFKVRYACYVHTHESLCSTAPRNESMMRELSLDFALDPVPPDCLCT